jgi:hypothetical protein
VVVPPRVGFQWRSSAAPLQSAAGQLGLAQAPVEPESPPAGAASAATLATANKRWTTIEKLTLASLALNALWFLTYFTSRGRSMMVP